MSTSKIISDVPSWWPTWLPKWLPQALFESSIILFGIILAFALEEWKDEKKTENLIAHSITNFENEIKQNNSRIKDVMIFHKGIQRHLQKQSSKGKFNSIVKFRSIMDSMKPIALSNSAWETAVATGALAQMDFELVSALTLTYNTQKRFSENYRATVRTLLTPSSLTLQNLELTLHATSQFVTEVTAQEAELSIFYNQMLMMLHSYQSPSLGA